MSERLRVLHVTRNLPPLIGGMERLNFNILRLLCSSADLAVVGPEGCAEELTNACHPIREVALKPLWKFLIGSFIAAIRMARSYRPQVVFAGSGLTAPAAWFAARCCGGRAIVYVHGLDIANDSFIYRLLWLPFLRRMDGVIANSSPTARLAMDAGIAVSKITIIHPGVDTLASVDRSRVGAFREQYALADRPILLSVGRLTERKGLREFIRDILPMILARIPDAVLVIIGDEAKDSINARGQSRESILRLAQECGVERSIRVLGRVSEGVLQAAYAAAGVHVFPVIEIAGDPEGFGMVAVEAATVGLRTVAFAVGGVVDAVIEGQTGVLIPSGNTAKFADAVCGLLQREPDSQQREICMRAAVQFDWESFGAKLLRELQCIRSDQ